MAFESLNWLIIGFALGYFCALGLDWIFRSALRDIQKDVSEELKRRLELILK